MLITLILKHILVLIRIYNSKNYKKYFPNRFLADTKKLAGLNNSFRPFHILLLYFFVHVILAFWKYVNNERPIPFNFFKHPVMLNCFSTLFEHVHEDTRKNVTLMMKVILMK